MRPKMKSTQNEVLSSHEKNYAYMTFHVLGLGWNDPFHKGKSYLFLWNICMCRCFLLDDFISDSIYMTFCHSELNFKIITMKWHMQWLNSCKKLMYTSSCKFDFQEYCTEHL